MPNTDRESEISGYLIIDIIQMGSFRIQTNWIMMLLLCDCQKDCLFEMFDFVMMNQRIGCQTQRRRNGDADQSRRGFVGPYRHAFFKFIFFIITNVIQLKMKF